MRVDARTYVQHAVMSLHHHLDMLPDKDYRHGARINTSPDENIAVIACS